MTTETAKPTGRIIHVTVNKFRVIYSALGLHANKYLPSQNSETKSALIMKAYQPTSETLEKLSSKLDRKHLTPRESGKGVNVKGAAELVRKRREFGETMIPLKLPKILLNADDFPTAISDKDEETADDRKNRIGNAAIKVDLGPLYDWSKDQKDEKELFEQRIDADVMATLEALTTDLEENGEKSPDVPADAGAPAADGAGPKLVKDPAPAQDVAKSVDALSQSNDEPGSGSD